MSDEYRRCKQCDAILKLWKYRAGTPIAFESDTLAKMSTADRKPPQFGANGNNAFCSIKCGFNYAVRHLRDRRFP